MQPSTKRALGAYYTPAPLVAEALAGLPPLPAGAQVVDLACGDGAWLAEAQTRWPGAQLLGMDIDEPAVERAARRLPEAELLVADGLSHPLDSVDLIVGNPPWGIGRGKRVRRGEESATRFLLRALEVLRPGGRLCLLLPAAWLEVAAHREARDFLLHHAAIERLEYFGDVFPGVLAPAALLVARREPDARLRASQWVQTAAGRVQQAQLSSDPERALNPRLGARDRALIAKLEGRAHRLAGRVTFILGVVTGKNATALTEGESGEPIISGRDVSAYRIGEPARRLVMPLDELQQAAPADAYRRVKVVYRFISSHPVAAVDEAGRLTLNSANAFAVDEDGLDPHYLAAVLNSTAARFWHVSRHSLPRVLRAHLERLPLPPARGRDIATIAQLAKDKGAAAADELDERIFRLYALTPGERTHARSRWLRS